MKSKMNFFEKYFNRVNKKISLVENSKLIKLSKILVETKKRQGKVIIVGNGGSAAMASHVSVDLTKVCNIRSVNFNEADLLTCFGNDYGYENWVKKAIEFYADKKDLAIFISSSGNSQNIIKGIKQAKKMNLKTVTFSGFSKNNNLRKLGDLNFWVDNKEYNIVEMTHHVWLLSAVDYIVAKK